MDHQAMIEKIPAITAQETPMLPAEELRSHVREMFRERNRYMEILDGHPPPLYVLETRVLRQRAQRFRRAFGALLPSTGFYYALKSNNHPDVARTLLDSKFGLDVSSGPELETALALGAGDIIFSGPGKTCAELSLAADHTAEVTVLLDSPGEMHRLERIARAKGVKVRAGVRLTTCEEGFWRKFGIFPDTLPEFIGEAENCSHLLLRGIQFHTSWNLSAAPQTAFIERLGTLLKKVPEKFLREMEFLDIGGGYWPGRGEWLNEAGTPKGILNNALGMSPGHAWTHRRLPAAPIESFAEKIAGAIEKHIFPLVNCRICFEPGRWLVNDAMHLFISVVDRKAPDLVITDAGTNMVGWERFESDYCPVLNLSNPSTTERLCHILGSLCTPHDMWGHAYWGGGIEPGDILMIPNQGAYTYSLRQEFIKALPKVLTL